MKESIPRLSRAAVIWHPPSGQNQEVQLKEIKETARSLSLKLQPLEVRQRDDFDGAFRAARREKAGALLISQGAFFGTYRALRAWVEISIADHFRRS
jgi:ABC-type uncharacterized transport system substrate-binding protein